jgi:hypothetical protein
MRTRTKLSTSRMRQWGLHYQRAMTRTRRRNHCYCHLWDFAERTIRRSLREDALPQSENVAEEQLVTMALASESAARVSDKVAVVQPQGAMRSKTSLLTTLSLATSEVKYSGPALLHAYGDEVHWYIVRCYCPHISYMLNTIVSYFMYSVYSENNLIIIFCNHNQCKLLFKSTAKNEKQ